MDTIPYPIFLNAQNVEIITNRKYRWKLKKKIMRIENDLWMLMGKNPLVLRSYAREQWIKIALVHIGGTKGNKIFQSESKDLYLIHPELKWLG